METITAFKCSFCTKIYINAKQAKAHEKKCYQNPDTKSCATCQNFQGQHGCSLGISFKGRKLLTGCEKHITHEDFLEQIV